MKMNRVIEFKELQPDGSFEGILTTYNVIDGGNDVVEPGAYTKTINDHGAQIPMLWQHKSDEPIGMLTLIDGPDALRVKGQLLLDLPTAQKAYALIKNKIVKGLSIGYDAIKKEMDGTIRRLKEIRLWEGSIVTFPMAELSLITSVKSKKQMGEMEDFNAELMEAQLQAAFCQMMCALCASLCECMCCDAPPADKPAMCKTLIDQFSMAFVAYCANYMTVWCDEGMCCPCCGRMNCEGENCTCVCYCDNSNSMGMMSRGALSTKAGRTISAATNAQLMAVHAKVKEIEASSTEACDMLNALLPADAGKSIPTPEIEVKANLIQDFVFNVRSMVEEYPLCSK